MGRAQLSARYNTHDAPRSKRRANDPPRYVDAPFDLDADAPDAVYEAFLTPEEVRAREAAQANDGTPTGRTIAIPPREAAPSPVESIDSDGDTASEATTTQPSTRVPTPRADSPAESGLRVLTLLEPLSSARDAAAPALQAAVAAGITDCPTLALRLVSILRPCITAALSPFRNQIPEVEILGSAFERSIVLDILGPDSVTSDGPRFSRAEILAGLNAADEVLFTRAARTASASSQDAQELVADPGSEEHSDAGSIDRSVSPASTGSWISDGPAIERQEWWNDRPWNRRIASPTRPSPILHPRTVALSTDVDTDDDSRSTTSSSAASSTPRSPAFTPRVFRARDLVIRPRPMVQVPSVHVTPSGISPFRTPSPLR